MPELTPNAVDRHFARLMVELHGAECPELEEAARTVSAWRAAGHICVPLTALTAADPAGKLRGTRVVGAPGDFKPLILDDAGRLYLHRYWAYEDQLARAILARVNAAAPAFDAERLAGGLDRYFRDQPGTEWQRRAAEVAVRNNLSVITGAPGTGKTHTVTIVLALLQEQFAARGVAAQIALAAPTGKAAARMNESIQVALGRLSGAERLQDAALPQAATTLHRLLGTIPDSSSFRHHAGRLLPFDVLIVDEASMVDLALMAKLLAALPASSRLILLGDKNQLASVEAGSVLADICAHADEPEARAPLAERIVELHTNFRFGKESAIHRFSTLVNQGDSAGAFDLLRAPAHAGLVGAALPATASFGPALRGPALEGFAPCLTTPDPQVALHRLNEFRVLCALRDGPFGVRHVNRLIEAALADAGLIKPDTSHYPGRPVLILRNDYNLHVFNGDVGLILPDPAAAGALRAFFLMPDGAVRRLLPSRLPDHETTFAMTVHKSQGSEFDRVLLLLPDQETPVLTRELIYTGATRARRSLEVWFSEPILRQAIARRVERTSGLRDLLWRRESSRGL